VRNDLNGYIISSTQEDLLILPNNFLEIKGSDDFAAVAKRQTYYDGILGAQAMHELQSYGLSESVYDNNAYIITAIYYNGQLLIYTTHLIQSINSGDLPEYYIN
jgi:hypothetical protein